MSTAETLRVLPGMGRSRRVATLVVALVSTAGLASLPLATAPAAAQSPAVSIVDFGFAPAIVQATMVGPEPGFLQPHAHVGFTNNGGVQHNVTFDDGRIPSSPTLNPNQFFDAVITIAGTFSYHCSIHPTMRGSVTVAPFPTTTTSTTTEQPVTAAPATTPQVTAAPTTTTAPLGPTVAIATTRPPAGAGTTTTTAPPPTTSVPSSPAPTETTTAPTTEPPSATTTAARVGVGVDTAARNPAPAGPRWPLLLLLAVLLGAGVFTGRLVWLRRRRSPGER